MNELTVTLLGSGNVAAFLLHSLAAKGIAVERIVARNEEKVRLLAESAKCGWCCDFSCLGGEKNIIISAVKDDAARTLWQECSFGNRLVLHTAGTLPLEELAPFARNYGVLYPLQTISAHHIIDSTQVPFLIEGSSAENLEKIRQLAGVLSPMVQVCSSETRKKIHLAAVFANNFSNLCFRIAWELAEKENLDPQMLLPLIEESCRKLRFMTPAEAQTGPAVRWDENVMEKHLELLKEMPEAAAIYRQASAEIHRREK